jgi:hypothetical protein
MQYLLNSLLIITGYLAGGIGGSLLFDFSYPPANFEVGGMIGSLVAIICIIIKNKHYLK